MHTELQQKRLWSAYCNNVSDQRQPSLEKLGIAGLRFERQRRFIPPQFGQELVDFQSLERLKLLWETFEQERKTKMLTAKDRSQIKAAKPDERKMLELGLEFFNAAYYERDLDKGKVIHAQGFPLNFQHPRCGSTILHVAASTYQEDMAKWAIGTGEADLLIQDHRKMNPYDKAMYYFVMDQVFTNIFFQATSKQLQAKVTETEYKADYKARVQFWRASDWYQNDLTNRAERHVPGQYPHRVLEEPK